MKWNKEEWKEAYWIDVLDIRNGKNQKKVVNTAGQYPIYGSGGIMGYADKYLCPEMTTIIGRKGSINNPILVKERFWNVDTAFGLIPKDELENRYFFYFCKKYNFLKHNKATTLPSLTKADLLKIQIPLPPLHTQKEIADLLDTADALRQKTQAQLDALDDLAQSVFLEMFGDVENSKLLIDISIKITDGTHQSPQFVEEGIPFLLISNIVDNQIVFSTKKYISMTEYNLLYRRTPVEIGDLLITTVGSYGNPAIVKTNKKFMFQRHIGYIKPDHDKINYIYLFGALKSTRVRRQIEKKVRGVAQKTLNLKELKTLLIPLPSIDLQNQFAAIIENIEAQKASLKASLQESEDLFGCLLQEVFG
jgi:type I restriction enzyme S subunit